MGKIEAIETVTLDGFNSITKKREVVDVELIENAGNGICVIRHPDRGLLTVNGGVLNKK
tara:strand:+ start:35684 stop:35860 length:177 start_codon:yes stop_codon:yes gene_type:complete